MRSPSSAGRTAWPSRAFYQAHIQIGRRFRIDERHDEAIVRKQALEIVPDREKLYHELGGYLWDLERRPEAYEVFAAYQKRKPEHIETLYALGRLSLEMQQWQQGIAWGTALPSSTTSTLWPIPTWLR